MTYIPTPADARPVTVAGAITMSSTDRFILVKKTTPAATTVTLMANPPIGRAVSVKDAGGTAAANNITVVPASGTIDGSANVIINANYGAVSLTYNGTEWNVIGNTGYVLSTAVITNPNAFDPNHISADVTLSNSNLTATVGGGGGLNEEAYAVASATTGKFYWEVVPTYNVAQSPTMGIGTTAAATAAGSPGNFIGSSTLSLGWNGASGALFYNGGTPFTAWATFTTGNRLSFALDLTAGKFWGRVGTGNWNNDILANQNPATGTGGLALPAGLIGPAITAGVGMVSVGDTVTASFATASWTNTPPVGFGAWTVSVGTTQGVRPLLIGIGSGTPTGTTPAFHTVTGYYPDLTNAYMSPDANFQGGGGAVPDATYTWACAQQSYNTGAATPLSSVTTSASGGYDTNYANGINAISTAGKANIYAVRINHEWGLLNQWTWGPWIGKSDFTGSPTVSPTTWINSWRRLAHAWRNNPATAHVKIAWDYPLKAMGGHTPPVAPNNYEAYYPRDVSGDGFGDLVDIIGTDWYSGNTPFAGYVSFSGTNTSPYGLTDWANFAASKGKPMAIWEWGNIDNAGTSTELTATINFIKANNFCAVVYWTDASNASFPWSFTSSTAEQTAFVNGFGSSVIGTTYTGNFFTYIPLPGTKPTGF